MTDVNVGYLAKLAQTALNKITQGDDYMLSDVHSRTLAAYERFPEDPVIRAVAFTIEKRAEKSGPAATINQKEISDIYNECVRLSANSKFRDVLGDLLLTKVASNAAVNEEFVKSSRPDENSYLDLNKYVDQDLMSSFSSVLSSTDKFSYSKNAQGLGAKYIKAEFGSIGFNSVKVDFLGGDNKSLVYSVAFDTSNGLVKVAVPVEISSGQLNTPKVFFDGAALKLITAENINEFLPKAVNTSSVVVRDDGNFLSVDDKVTMPNELAHLAQDFENQLIEAASKFGRDAIQKGKEIVAYELRTAGFKSSQVRFGSDGTNGVIYIATIDSPAGQVDIQVVSEMRRVANDRYMPLAPSCFVHDGVIEDFSKDALHRFALSMPKPNHNVKYATAYEYMTMKDLKEAMLKCVANNDHSTAEEILNHIQTSFSEDAFKNALADYQNLLVVKAKNQNNSSIVKNCSLQIKAGKTSMFPVCGHHHVPMDKVVVGEDGVCRLKSTIEREMMSSSDGVLLSNYKILM